VAETENLRPARQPHHRVTATGTVDADSLVLAVAIDHHDGRLVEGAGWEGGSGVRLVVRDELHIRQTRP
jgi:hypothetical protein